MIQENPLTQSPCKPTLASQICAFHELIMLLLFLLAWGGVMALRCSNPMLFAIPYAGVWIFSCMALAKGIGAWMEKLGPLKNNPLLFISLSMARLLFVLVVFAFLRENVQADILRPMVLIGVGFFIFSSLAGAVLKLNSQSLK